MRMGEMQESYQRLRTFFPTGASGIFNGMTPTLNLVPDEA